MKHSLTKIFCIDPCVIKNAFLLLHPLSEGSARGGGADGGRKKFWGNPLRGTEKVTTFAALFGGAGSGSGSARRREAVPGGVRVDIRKEFFDAMVPI